MGFFSNIGSKIANTAESIGKTIKGSWQTIGSTIKNGSNMAGKVAGVVQHLTAGSSNPYLKGIHEGAGQVVKYADIVNQGHGVADKFVSALERSSRDVSHLGRGGISPSQFKDRTIANVNQFKHQTRNIG